MCRSGELLAYAVLREKDLGPGGLCLCCVGNHSFRQILHKLNEDRLYVMIFIGLEILHY